MKRTTAIFALIFAAILLFAGCKASQVYTVYSKGVTYTVDKAEQTITDGRDIYKYECDPSDGGGYTVKFIYPDGQRLYRCQPRITGGVRPRTAATLTRLSLTMCS